MSNEYHVLNYRPTLNPKRLGGKRERLAKRLVQSGKLRIRTDTLVNFVNNSGSDYEHSFSFRELTDINLQAQTRQRIAALIPGGAGEAGIIQFRQMLIDQLKPIRNVPEEREMEVARLLTQACEPEVMEQVIREGCEVFVSYSHNVADLMAVHFWENHGLSNGLQSVSGDGSAVYVSCGGDPFITDIKHKTYTSDGLPALARFMVIAGQELGHFADIKRGGKSRAHGRHSANLFPMRASPGAKHARDADGKRIEEIKKFAARYGINALARRDKAVRFLRSKRKDPFSYALFGLVQFASFVHIRGVGRLRSGLCAHFPWRSYSEYDEGLAAKLVRCVQDMQDNLTPTADVYQRPDPLETEAIACIEAVARVPQQVNKWGHATTKFCWPELYRFYYGQVIPALKELQEETPPH